MKNPTETQHEIPKPDTIEINLPHDNVKDVVINGRLVFRDGQFVVPWTIDQEVLALNTEYRSWSTGAEGFKQGVEWAKRMVKK